jgi:hypothetical protein
LERVLNRLDEIAGRSREGVAGYSAYLPLEDGAPQWQADPGILTGAAGIALALLAATTPIEPAWDRMMLVSGLINDEMSPLNRRA